jgi:hypothetical protein
LYPVKFPYLERGVRGGFDVHILHDLELFPRLEKKKVELRNPQSKLKKKTSCVRTKFSNSAQSTSPLPFKSHSLMHQLINSSWSIVSISPGRKNVTKGKKEKDTFLTSGSQFNEELLLLQILFQKLNAVLSKLLELLKIQDAVFLREKEKEKKKQREQQTISLGRPAAYIFVVRIKGLLQRLGVIRVLDGLVQFSG